MNLGHELGRSTIKRILADAGLEPAPELSKRTTWKTSSKAHWEAISAMDFFTVEVLTWRGFVRYFVLFAIDLKTRRVHITGLAGHSATANAQSSSCNGFDITHVTFATNLALYASGDLLLDDRAQVTGVTTIANAGSGTTDNGCSSY